MSRRSTVYAIPEAIREELDRCIVAAGLGRYAEHAAWLADQGYAVSESALKRYGKRLKLSADKDAALAREKRAAVVARVREAAVLARAVNEAAGDDPLAVPEKTAELLIARLYEIAAAGGIDAKTLQAITRSLNDSLRTVAAIRSERDEVRAQAAREAKARAVGEGERKGLRPAAAAAFRALIQDNDPTPLDTLMRIRRDVYGIHEDGDDCGVNPVAPPTAHRS